MVQSIRVGGTIAMWSHATTVGLGLGADHLAQFEFFGKLLVQDAEIIDQFATSLEDGGSRVNGAVGSNAKFNFAVGYGVREFRGRMDAEFL